MATNINWSEEARAGIRALDRTTAMFVFEGLLRYAQTGHGDVKALSGELEGRLRLRAGDYRIFFSPVEDGLHMHSVKHRREAYR